MIKASEKSKPKPYFSIIEIIDEIFPPISVFDYTKIPKEDLKQRFQKIIEEKIYGVSKEKITYILNEINSKHELIYGKDHHALKGFTTEKDFDQRNYSIQNYVSSLKNTIINQICNKHLKYLYNGKKNYKYNTTYMGNIDSIKIINNREKISNYVFSTLNVSKEDIDCYNLDCETIAKDILLHFGISPNVKDSLKPNNFLIDLTKKFKILFR